MAFITKFLAFIKQIGIAMLSFLPDSPFLSFFNTTIANEYLSALNWFVPIDKMIVLGESWLVAIGIFYLYQLVLRWAKAIE